MQNIKLTSGGILLEKIDEKWIDITDKAHMNLYRHISLENVSVHDIYKLIDGNLVIRQILKHNYVDEFLAYINDKNFKIKTSTNERPDTEIEYLEIYRIANYDSELNSLEFEEVPAVHARSYILQQDYEGYKAGSRIPWGIDFTPIEDLLNIPIIFDSEVICENNNYLNHYEFSNKKTFERKLYSLFDVVNAITWELSFHGTPSNQQERKEMLDESIAISKEMMENLDKNQEEDTFSEVPTEKIEEILYEDFLLKGFKKIDKSVDTNILSSLLNYLPNKVDITLFFNHILPNKIFLKEEFIGLNAYEYRHKVYDETTDLLPSIHTKKIISSNKSLLAIHDDYVEETFFSLVKKIGGKKINKEELFSFNMY